MTRMTPSEAFVETMAANNVTKIFSIMGSAFMDAMDIFEPAGINLISVVHEQGAGHMADGYSRVSGQHGVCIGQNGPGISNCVTAIVFHNRQWGAEKKNQVDFYGRRFAAGELENQSFANIGRAMGSEGVTVDKLEDDGPALNKAIDMQMNEGKTTVLEIMCTRELGDPFRRDALSKPVRYLDKYKEFA